MAGVFLIGGGREDAQVRASHAPFVAACAGGPIVAFALEDPERWASALRLCAEEAGEDLDEPAVRDGLGLVPFAHRVAPRDGAVVVSVQP